MDKSYKGLLNHDICQLHCNVLVIYPMTEGCPLCAAVEAEAEHGYTINNLIDERHSLEEEVAVLRERVEGLVGPNENEGAKDE